MCEFISNRLHEAAPQSDGSYDTGNRICIHNFLQLFGQEGIKVKTFVDVIYEWQGKKVEGDEICLARSSAFALHTLFREERGGEAKHLNVTVKV